MTVAEERYEKAWNSFLIYLNHHPKAQLKPFLIERHINHRTYNRIFCFLPHTSLGCFYPIDL